MTSTYEKEWQDEEIIPISALSHYQYCSRQYALIHVEGIFVHNDLTVGGKLGHEVVDEVRGYTDHGVRRETSLRVYSDVYGLSGIADVVEFPDGSPPFPIDYKHGKTASWKNHEVQLCAIALCLEEMLEVEVPAGAIYHLQSRKRRMVEFTDDLRKRTINLIDEIRDLVLMQRLPPPVYSRKCHRCSLLSVCQPEVASNHVEPIFEPVELL